MFDTNYGKKDEYEERGDYHGDLDPNWTYYPTYLAKKKFILRKLEKKSKDMKILDMGCGEGIFVKELKSRGFLNVWGIDLNYESNVVKRGDILETGFGDKEFDVVLLLDVIEHLSFEEQEKVLVEIKRIIKDGGEVIFSIPNLAHLYSRLKFLFKGSLKRTANIKKHPGDRPIGEYIKIIECAGFEIISRKGLFPTYPFFFNVILASPRRTLWLYNIFNKVAAYPNFCFANIIICKKERL